MKTMKVLTVLGLASALSLGYNGPLEIKYTNFDVGTVYNANPSDLEYGETDLNSFSRTQVKKAWNYTTNAFYDPINDPSTDDLEDAWFVFRVDTIKGSGGVTLWSSGGATGLEVVGMGFGLKDVALQVSAAGVATIYSDDMDFKMWAQPMGNFDYTDGTAGRTGLDTYDGIGDLDGDGDFDAADELLGAILLVDAAGVTGLLDKYNDTPLFDNDLIPDALPAYNHVNRGNETDAYLNKVITTALWTDGVLGNTEIVTGTQNDPISEKNFDNPIDTDDMDIWINSSLRTFPGHPLYDPAGSSGADWQFVSDDPALTNVVVPEPLTMIALFGGVAGLGGYIRKRRMA